MKDLYESLKTYTQTDIYPFHMPGHKRRLSDVYDPSWLDITEIYGFDNLHHATGILKEAQKRAAHLYGAPDSFFLVNGSTCGILAAVCASVKKGERLLMARNCHKAAYHGAELVEARMDYLYPMATEFGIQGSVDPADVEEKLNTHPDTAAVLITSPTYDGVVSDIAAIADIVHARHAILIVDEAHGAHFGFGYGFPEKAGRLGADLVIESLHKTLPAFTQTAILHRCSERVPADRLHRYLGIFQTSSPSYLFLACMDRLTTYLMEQGDELFSAFRQRLDRFYAQTKDLKCIRMIPAGTAGHSYTYKGIFARDDSKLLISTGQAGCTGAELEDILRCRFHLEMEMSGLNYVTALTSIMDTEDGFCRLNRALHLLDREFYGLPVKKDRRLSADILYAQPSGSMEIWEAGAGDFMTVELTESAGKIVADYIYLYPPGIPVLVPGEQMSDDILHQLLLCQEQGYQLEGMTDLSGKTIRICQRG